MINVQKIQYFEMTLIRFLILGKLC